VARISVANLSKKSTFTSIRKRLTLAFSFVLLAGTLPAGTAGAKQFRLGCCLSMISFAASPVLNLRPMRHQRGTASKLPNHLKKCVDIFSHYMKVLL
jgi:hypothetical protein